MKEVAILLLITLMLNGCGSSTTTSTQTAAGGTWEAQLLGGQGQSSGFSFITQFTVEGSGGSLSISGFQFLTAGACFPTTGGTESGSMNLTVNTSTNAVSGTLTYSVQSGGNTLTLNGTSVTGTESGTTLSGGSVTGTWTLAGGTGCNDATGGSFTMTQH